MIDRDLDRSGLKKATGVSDNVVTKINNDESISLTNLVKICQGLKVQASEVIEIMIEKD